MEERGLAMEFDPEEFAKLVYRNHSSTDFGIFVNDPRTRVHPDSDAQKQHVIGHNGDFRTNNDAFNNVTETFACTVIRNPQIYKTWDQFDDAIMDWLQIGADQPDYLQFTADPDWAYYAMAQPYTLTPDSVDSLKATLNLIFDCDPLMYSIRGLEWKKLPESGIIYNSTARTVHPEFHIKGSGDFQLIVNGMSYYLDDVEDEIWIRSDGNCYELDSEGVKELADMKARFVNGDSPEFLCGKNTVEFKRQDVASEADTSADQSAQPTQPTAPAEPATCEYKAKWEKVA